MARTGGVVNYNTFVKGLITEASPLTFPENATLREENFDLRRDGTRARRLGMDFEASYVQGISTDKALVNSSVLMSYEWFNAGNSRNENFLVVQVGDKLHIYDMITAPISANKRTSVINLSNYKVTSNPIIKAKNYPVNVSALKGNLIIVSSAIEPILISYDASSGIFSVTKITVETRDLFGIDDETPSIDNRPTDLSSKHEYNLRNQGWKSDDITLTRTDLGVYPSNADLWHLAKQTSFDTTAGTLISDLGKYSPALLEREGFGTTPAPKGKFIYNLFNREYKDLSSSVAKGVSSMTYNEGSSTISITTTTSHGLVVGDEIKLKDVDIYVTYASEDYEGNATTVVRAVSPENNTLSDKFFTVVGVPSPGIFTISWFFNTEPDVAVSNAYFFRDLKGLSSIGSSNTSVVVPSTAIVSLNTQEDFRFKATSGYAGRAWYAGLDGGSYGSYLFFSQILDDPTKIGKCYQEADPTSEHVSDLVDTDGGFVVIPEARNIQALVPMGQFLFVFSTNGVWRVFGDDGGNFSATGYSVEKVSDIGVNSRFSIVPVENEVYYWALGGIYKLSQAEVSGNYSATNISQLSVQTLFFDIGASQQTFVKGSYDSAEKKILWLYNRSPVDTNTDYHYNSILTFDLILGAFYQSLLPVSVGDNTPFISGLFALPTVNVLQTPRNVVNNSNQVITVGGDNVISTLPTPRDQVTQTKFLTVSANGSNYEFTFSEFNQIGFLDFKSYDNVGTDAAAFMITGSDTQGSQANKKQIHYLIMYFNRTETALSLDINGNVVSDNPSSCLVNVLWDWATDINSVRAGSQFQAYRPSRYYVSDTPTDPYTYGEDTIVTKSKLRGRGRAFSLAIQSEPGKDLHIYGWSLLASGGQRV